MAINPVWFCSQYTDTAGDRCAGSQTARLGVEGEGKYRDFQGTAAEVWPQVCATYVQWVDEDNEKWLADLKRKATRLPDTILRPARADRLLWP